jgi:hypothetical protein
MSKLKSIAHVLKAATNSLLKEEKRFSSALVYKKCARIEWFYGDVSS